MTLLTEDDHRLADVPPEVEQPKARDMPTESRHHFRRGDWAEVRSEAEILATLDAEGKLEGMPFLREMRPFCGRRFQVYRRAERIFLDHFYYVARLKNTVLLENVRCSGAAHADCQMRCLLFWKEAWLKPVKNPEATGASPVEECTTADSPGGDHWAGESPSPRLPHPNGLSSAPPPNALAERMCCQATELVRATRPLPWWDFRQYWHDVCDGERTVGEILRFFARRIPRKIAQLLGFSTQSVLPREAMEVPTHGEKLDLQPGQWVEIKPLPEILATLDAQQRHRGLGFGPEMARFCGGRFRVANRIERVILEWSGELRRIRDTVALEGVICDGQCCRHCPRSCYIFWREVWLRRVE